ncbi:MAG: PDZ domain-containing protein [Eubacterium sp.]|nr:PDZ domain-containing protein [Eubacterium sp.]
MKINVKKLVRFLIIAGVFVAAVTLLAAYAAVILSGRSIVKNDVLKEKDEKIARLGKLYEMKDDIDADFLFDADENASMDAMASALAGSLGDEYSEYMTAEEITEWENAVNNGFTGIGITSNAEDGRAVVLSVADDGPADAAGIKEGDVIKEVNGKAFDNERDFLKAIAGKPGDTLKLTVLRGWYTFDVDVTIAEVKMRAVSSKVINKDIGYIRITTFSRNSSDEFAAELKDLTDKQVKGLVIDLRDNGGGYVDQGIKICDAILPECTIGYLENKKGERETFNSDEECVDVPVVVLVNEKTASASEIVAAAVKGNKAGTVAGVKTYGKGLSQKEYKFSDGSCLKLTVAQYLTPAGDPIDGKGVKPDKKIKESDDPDAGDVQLKGAVKLIQ